MAVNIRLVKCLARRYGPDEIRVHIVKFADDLDVSYGAVKKWIYAGRRPRYATMKRIERITEGRMKLEHW